jgi:hypothetical protein
VNALISFRLKFQVDLKLQMQAIDCLIGNFSITCDLNLLVIGIWLG